MAKEVDEIAEKLGSKEGGEETRYWRRMLGRLFSPIVLESFLLTFLAEVSRILCNSSSPPFSFP